MDANGLTNEELYAGFVNDGRRDFFDELYRRFHGDDDKLRIAISSKYQGAGKYLDLDEIALATWKVFLDAEDRPPPKDIEDFERYLCGVAFNIAADELKKQRKVPRLRKPQQIKLNDAWALYRWCGVGTER